MNPKRENWLRPVIPGWLDQPTVTVALNLETGAVELPEGIEPWRRLIEARVMAWCWYKVAICYALEGKVGALPRALGKLARIDGHGIDLPELSARLYLIAKIAKRRGEAGLRLYNFMLACDGALPPDIAAIRKAEFYADPLRWRT